MHAQNAPPSRGTYNNKKAWDAGMANDSRNEGRKKESEETEVTHHTPRKALPSWVSRFVPVLPHQSHGYNP